MTLSDKVLDAAEKHGVLKSKLDKLDKQLNEVLEAVQKDGADEDVLMPQIEELTAQVEDLRPQVEASDKKVKALKQAEQALAARATPVTQAPGIIKSFPKAPESTPGDLFVRSAIVKAIAFSMRRPEEEILEQRYGHDDQLKAVFGWQRKTAVAAADTTTAGWAAELVQNDIRGFLDMITNISVGAALATRGMMLDFAGYHSVTIPRMNQIGATPTEPAWVGEGGVIPLQQFSFGSTTLARYKLASIVPMTNELAQQSNPAAEAVMRRGMQESYSIMLDNALLSSAAAVAGVRPAGLLVGAATAAGSAAGTGIENLVADLTGMLNTMAAAGLGQRPVLILNDQNYISVGMLMNPLGQMMFRDDINGGRLLGVEVVHSRNAPVNTAILVDAAALATAFDGPEFMVSEHATLTMANADGTAPTQAGTDATPGAVGAAGQVPVDSGIPVAGGAGASTTGFRAQSLFQTYSTAIRGVWPTSWGLIRTGAVVTRTAIDWA